MLVGIVMSSRTHEKQLGKDNHVPHAIDNIRFIAGVARILTPLKELNGPYEACIATYGKEERAEKVVVSIVDTKRHLIIDHRMWLISEYFHEWSGSIEAAMDGLTDDMTDYCERSRVGKVFMVDKPFPLKELEEGCPHCGEQKVRVPWQDR